MQIDHKTVDEIAHLARLEFNDEAKNQMVSDMNNMIKFVEKLNELDTSSVEPLIYMSSETNVLRADQVEQELTHTEALKNAPSKDSDYFRVPKVINQ